MERPLAIAICDADREDRANTRAMTEKVLSSAGYKYTVSEFDSAESFLEALAYGEEFQVLLCEVLPGSGIELAEQLRARKNPIEIVFVSANTEMALRGYEVNAARYLAKPLAHDKLREALLYCGRVLQEKKDIVVPTDRGRRIVALEDIHMAEACERGTKIYCSDETLNCRLKFGELEQLLSGGGFVVCHRSYIVNISMIQSIRRYEFDLSDGRKVPIGRARYSEMQRKFFTFA